MPNLFQTFAAGDTLPADTWNDSFDEVEASFGDVGPLVVTGLVPSAGTGLSVNVTSGTALIGGDVVFGALTISGLADATTNHLYVLQNGTGTSNTTGTAPANSAKIGTAVTAGGIVTSVATNWTSGRQFKRRTEDLVHGSGAGHPRAVDLASWHATNNEGNETKGVLPTGALPTGGGNLAQATKTANYTATDSDYFLWVDCTSGAVTITLPTAVGRAGKVFVIKKIDATVNTCTVDANGSQTIDGGLTAVLTIQYESISLASDNANWWIF